MYAVRHEAAIHLVDVLTRRSRLHLLPEICTEFAEPVSFIMQRELGWSESTRQQELQSYTDCVTLKSMHCVKEFSNANNTYSPIELGGADQHLEGTWVPVKESVAESLSSICRVTRLEGNELAVAELSRDWWPLALHWALADEVAGSGSSDVDQEVSTGDVGLP